MELLGLISLLIVIIMVMDVLYLHTLAIKEQIKWKSFNTNTIIYDVFIYLIGLGIIGFCVYYIISI